MYPLTHKLPHAHARDKTEQYHDADQGKAIYILQNKNHNIY